MNSNKGNINVGYVYFLNLICTVYSLHWKSNIKSKLELVIIFVQCEVQHQASIGAWGNYTDLINGEFAARIEVRNHTNGYVCSTDRWLSERGDYWLIIQPAEGRSSLQCVLVLANHPPNVYLRESAGFVNIIITYYQIILCCILNHITCHL